ncbi:hypothetical protein NBRC116601_21950 [Cognatishimia sp. WU-CL00825]|uniref:flagellar biosynthesis protein FlgN n=1 Tax=Cognatishimia sp. WU-CL00825 TaxID=3127658 RepID=UPI00310BE649
MPNDVHTILADLDRLLTQERAHLLTGNLRALGDLLQEKEELLAQIARIEGQQLPVMAPLKSRMLNNQSLLESAMQGIRAAADRLRDLRQVQEGLETYDAGGKRHSFAKRTGRDLEKRA